ncbi:AraC family carnitine catabolism transcriptional activator [Pseudomonas duriflava]|uniref:AraC family carnitine catabolism transcriptional activator n=1 Tax=Pseudomonas duriflava TaxID=459528 RepID=A0A562QIC3_9PSED|nr:GlxA family transcriptional regulator [Pseudomonas duriflava]TWI56518.1 AraC family carnitine catabolism transcriptional activator [Pseudomonas duriflava]
MTQLFSFLLLPGFSAMGFISAIEPLRVANRFQPDAYRWRLLSRDGQPVTASNGMVLNTEPAEEKLAPDEVLFIVAGFEPLAIYDSLLARWLRRLDRDGATLGGIDTGSVVLATAGLLDGYRVTVHWEALAAFRESYPRLTVSQELYEIDGRRITCAGGTASIDLMLALISRAHSAELAVRVSEQFVLGRIRSPKEHQRLKTAQRYGISNRKLAQVLDTMERHTEPPLSTLELAESIDVTRRQLERLFQQHLDATPSGFYLALRLDKARHLLQQSDMSVLAVALACGFESPSYFSRCYRQRFGVSPRDDRIARPGELLFPGTTGPAAVPITVP